MARETSYGQKGGEGPTRGRKRTNYLVTLPDGTTATKGSFFNYARPTAYAYQHGGAWKVAGIEEADCPRFDPRNYTQCAAVAKVAGEGA